jgi:hypothetical protein
MKIDIEQIQTALEDNKIDGDKIKKILHDLQIAVEEEKADNIATSGPKPKWEYCIILNDPDKKVPSDITGWVVVQQEGQDSGLIVGKLQDAAKIQNEAAKRKKSLIQNFGELFEALKPKFLKEKGLKIKTKNAVRIIPINGKTL